MGCGYVENTIILVLYQNCCGACPVSLSAMDIVKLFEEDAAARKRLAELLVGEPDVRLAIINAVLRDVATKNDIEKLRGEIDRLREEISKLEERIDRLEDRVSRLEERVDMMFKFMLAFNTPILVAVIGILLKMVLTP